MIHKLEFREEMELSKMELEFITVEVDDAILGNYVDSTQNSGDSPRE